MNTPIFLDMVHHNPGEPPFETRFTNPKELSALGYTGQVLKHLNACIPLGFGGATEFPGTPEEEAWLAGASAMRDAEIAAAKRAGIATFYHVDLFVLPKRIIERHQDELCDGRGRVDVTRTATLELHRKLIAGLLERYPDVAGRVIRVGETHLLDTPHHGGNSAVPLHDGSIDREEKIRRFIILLERDFGMDAVSRQLFRELSRIFGVSLAASAKCPASSLPKFPVFSLAGGGQSARPFQQYGDFDT